MISASGLTPWRLPPWGDEVDHSPGRRGEPLLENRIEFLNRIIIGLRLDGDPRIEMLRHLVAGNAQLLEGTDYPLGLRTDLLPLEVRIVAVADLYDSLTETANFDPPLSADAIEAILRQAADAGRIDGPCLEVLLAAKQQCLAIQVSAMNG